MKNLVNLLTLALITSLIQSCTSLPSSPDHSSCSQEKIEVSQGSKPEIPMALDKAFFPLRVSPKGKIVPSYSWDECVSRFVVCLKWKQKIVYFEDLEWFYSGEYGLSKRPSR
jgi:hypothetical protein